MSRNEGPCNFEFPFVPPAVCNRCGADVRDRGVHDEWHEQGRIAETSGETDT